MNNIIEKALQRENDERESATVAKAQNLIRQIQTKRDQRDALAKELEELQTELRELTVPEALADNVLGA